MAAITITQEQLTTALHKAMEWQWDECPHGTYSGGGTPGESYGMCDIFARRIVERHVPGGKYGPDYKMDVFTLSPVEVHDLADALDAAMDSGAKVRVGVDAGLKIDTGIGWSLPMGTDTTGRS